MVRASFRGIACPTSPTREELTSIQAGHRNAAEPLLSRWEPIVLASARRRSQCLASRDDIAQAGRLAVLSAAKAFDPARGSSFNHYASRAVSNETLKAAQRLQSCRRGECPLDAAAEAQTETADAPFDCRDCVRSWICTLPRILMKVFVALYHQGLSQREASARLGVSQPRISQLRQILVVRGRRDLAGLMNRKSNVGMPAALGIVA
jgi:RNA polymerase sigma factor (sigma-70 family)